MKRRSRPKNPLRPSIRVNLLPVDFKAPALVVAKCRDCSATSRQLHELNYPAGKVLICRECLAQTQQIQARIIPFIKSLSIMQIEKKDL